MARTTTESGVSSKLKAVPAVYAQPFRLWRHLQSGLVRLCFYLRTGETQVLSDPVGSKVGPPLADEENAFFCPWLPIKSLFFHAATVLHLGRHCKPCHGDILAEIAESEGEK